MSNITLVGVDVAKEVFQIHGVDNTGKGMIKKKVYRSDLLRTIANMPTCTIAMEACGGSHHWARQFQLLGHQVKLISPQFVKPFVKTNKNDAHDAQAITEAASRPDMRFVPIKTKEQQDIQSIHRIRERLVGQRTALTNQIRGLLSEYGIVVPVGLSQLKKHLIEILCDYENELTVSFRELCNELYEELTELNKRIKVYDKKIEIIYKNNPVCQKLSAIEGIGPLSATMLATVLGDGSLFKNGRHFAAFLGLVPKQYSSGGKQVLLGISKRGDSYLRGLLIHGARAVLYRAKNKNDRRSVWLNQLSERRGYNKTCVALANKNARIVWALVAKSESYKKAA
ncbi:MAG TPA: IS110 family transposase [Candidatus Saccharimonadales bacterium]|nr:IS110 family transposase [Candidatus Saccharimonadales bacterium]